MSAVKDNVSYYDEFSAGYDSRRGHGYHAFLDDMQAALVLRHARPSHRVLEVGCGTGLIMSRLRGRVGSIEGVDLSPGMLARARERGLSVREASATHLPLPDSSFDVVYSFKVLSHVREVDLAFSEAARVLRPGGVAILELYNTASLRHLRKRLFAGRVAPGLTEAQVYTRFDDLETARARLERAGLAYLGCEGLVVLTPAAHAHEVPLLGGALRLLERAASASPLRRFGGFLSVVGRKS